MKLYKTLKHTFLITLCVSLVSFTNISRKNFKTNIPPDQYNITGGDFLQADDTGEVFIYMPTHGGIRHIQSYQTLAGLFRFKYSYLHHYKSYAINKVRGDELEPDNGLVQDIGTGIVYFREGNVIARIDSPADFDRYHFNSGAIQPVSNIRSFMLSPTDFYFDYAYDFELYP